MVIKFSSNQDVDSNNKVTLVKLEIGLTIDSTEQLEELEQSIKTLREIGLLTYEGCQVFGSEIYDIAIKNKEYINIEDLE